MSLIAFRTIRTRRVEKEEEEEGEGKKEEESRAEIDDGVVGDKNKEEKEIRTAADDAFEQQGEDEEQLTFKVSSYLVV